MLRTARGWALFSAPDGLDSVHYAKQTGRPGWERIWKNISSGPRRNYKAIRVIALHVSGCFQERGPISTEVKPEESSYNSIPADHYYFDRVHTQENTISFSRYILEITYRYLLVISN